MADGYSAIQKCLHFNKSILNTRFSLMNIFARRTRCHSIPCNFRFEIVQLDEEMLEEVNVRNKIQSIAWQQFLKEMMANDNRQKNSHNSAQLSWKCTHFSFHWTLLKSVLFAWQITNFFGFFYVNLLTISYKPKRFGLKVDFSTWRPEDCNENGENKLVKNSLALCVIFTLFRSIPVN